jgi:hypothetical protein
MHRPNPNTRPHDPNTAESPSNKKTEAENMHMTPITTRQNQKTTTTTPKKLLQHKNSAFLEKHKF